jgi:N-acetylglucosaminyl-diphospho-decaprenol L-rhamnosyltransferase
VSTSVVVLNYNAGPGIVDCLRSVADEADELVVVDNASTDGSTEHVMDSLPGTRIVRNDTNRGFAVAANQGVRAAAGHVVVLLNPDAVAEPGTIDAFVSAIEAHPRAGVVGALVRNPDGTVQPTKRAFPKLRHAAMHGLVGLVWPNNPGTRAYTLADASFVQARTVDWVAATAIAIRREAFEAVGGFDESFFFFVEDVDLCRRLGAAGWEVWFEPRARITHVWGGSWTKQPLRFLLMHQRNLYRYFRKYRRGPWILASPFVAAGLSLRFVLLAIRWLVTRRSVPKHRSGAVG